ncbi:putative defense protein 1 [Adelges cooleyi]|uniref:putative defense protein 1 n=1 Tax=Adelges cooleyi TaxID=133065 RepID=UPI00217F7ACF|nr:putative defense protein 1 [Adelges cooleyi]
MKATVLLLFALGVRFAESVTDKQLMIACDDMTPRHPGYPSEESKGVANPYVINVQPVPVVPGALVNVTLTSQNGTTTFRGFMIQGRDEDNKILGTFLPQCASENRTHHMISCVSGNEPYNAVVQSNNKNKTSESFSWVAPKELKGTFKFKFTIVQDYKHYWIGEETAEVQVAEHGENSIEVNSNYDYTIYRMYRINCPYD